MRERVHTFGEHGNLVGVYTEPAPTERERPVVVYLTAGLLHRVGPNRLHVELARELAERGYGGFRFDMSGVGDSASIPGARSGLDRYPVDVREALDFLAAEYGATRFVLVGLCSGADYAHVGAVASERVVGAVLLDGYAYPTRKYNLKRYAPKLASPRKIAGFIARRTRDRLGRSSPRDEAAIDVFARKLPPRETVETELEELLARGVALYFVYSGGQEHLNHAEQFGDMFPRLDTSSISVDYLPRADHTFMLLGDRRDLRDRLRAWLERTFPGTEPAADTAAREDDDSESFVF